MRVSVDDTVVAEAAEDSAIRIEGNWYFPPASITEGVLRDSPTPYTCPWKGAAQYHDVVVGGTTHSDAAWSYPKPYPSSFERVGSDYSGYVAFDPRQVTVE